MQFSVRVVVESDGSRYLGYCPNLKGVYADGDTSQDALERTKQAIQQHLEVLIERGAPIPIDVLYNNVIDYSPLNLAKLALSRLISNRRAGRSSVENIRLSDSVA